MPAESFKEHQSRNLEVVMNAIKERLPALYLRAMIYFKDRPHDSHT